MNDAVVVPLKPFDVAKDRLRRGGVRDVAAIAEGLARGVIAASSPRTVIVLSEDPRVTAFAESLGVEVRESRATGLNDAVQSAYGELTERFDRLIVVHGDLRYPQGIGELDPAPGVTLYADHLGVGTNVLVLPTGLDFHFAYGPGSLQRHLDEAQRLGVDCRVEWTSPWRFDVDQLNDLEDP